MFGQIKERDILVVDIEANRLRNPTKVHLVCTRNWEGQTNEFRNPLDNKQELYEHLSSYKTFVGHNFCQYDYGEVLQRLFPDHCVSRDSVLDTLVLSRLLKYDIPGGHSIKAWGERLGIKKEGQEIEQWEELTDDMVRRCHSDTAINLALLKKYFRYVNDPRFTKALKTEHGTAFTCAEMTRNGFPFDKQEAERMKNELLQMLLPIDEGLSTAFPPRPRFVREVHPRVTKTGAFNLNDFRWYDGDDLSVFNGGPFSLLEWEEFNAGSPLQVVDRLNKAGWKPTEKTKGHVEALKSKNTPKEKLDRFKEFGWKVSEENLKTLPESAPKAAFDLAKRILLQSRISDLEEWIALAEDEADGPTVHGSFSSIGAWTQRLSHSNPNLANVPVATRAPNDTEFQSLIADYNDRMRALWIARPGHVLIGTDADGIQMRIFAHLVGAKDLIEAIVTGDKKKGTDIHSLHQKKLGEDAKNRDAAKTFIYAWLLGAGNAKVAEILETTLPRAKQAVSNFIESYPGLKELKQSRIPRDAARGYFEGLDGRLVPCSSEHLMLAGYLQNGEAVIMKGACNEWQAEARRIGLPYKLRTWPHDEWQTEVPDDPDCIREIQRLQVQSIRDQAVRLNLILPLEGESKYGRSWKETH